MQSLAKAGIQHTFAIQALTLPIALAGGDVIGQARTGTGKTLGFGVPVLHRLSLPGGTAPQALIVVPTRELCLQVSNDLRKAGTGLAVRILPIYGGRPHEEQTRELRKGVDVIVGTPGRLLDLVEQGQLVLDEISCLVLDEADEMLDLGFLPAIERILSMVPSQRQTMLFSATMPGPIITLARTFLTRPTHVRAEDTTQKAIPERTQQFVYRAHALDKTELLAKALQADGRGLAMIFAKTKRSAQKVADDLAERGFACAAVHGDLGQAAREQALRAFRSGKIDVLVATDVAARGIDVDGVTHVINHQCPQDAKDYLHRIGRTGRAGRTGVAITLVDWDDQARWALISEELELGIPVPVETYSTSPHLQSDLGIPEGMTGRLPLGKRTRAGLDAEAAEKLPGRRHVSVDRKRKRRRAGVELADQRQAGSVQESGAPSAERIPRQRRRRRAGIDVTDTKVTGTAHRKTPQTTSASPDSLAD